MIKLTILDPETQELPEEVLNSNVLLLTNPVEQEPWVPSSFKGKKVTEDEFLNSLEFDSVNHQAKTWARTWFETPQVQEAITFKGFNLGAFVTRDLSYHWVSVMKAIWLFDEVLKQVKPDEVFIVGNPKNLWSKIARELAQRNGLSTVEIKVRTKSSPSPSFRKKLKEIAKSSLASFLLPRDYSKFDSQKIIFSSALKFALPFFKIEKGCLYLRDIFSFKAFQTQEKKGFHHLCLPKQTASSSINSEAVFLKIKNVFNGQFEFKGISSWEFLCDYFKELTDKVFPQACHLIRGLDRLLEQTKPAAIVTDEDVCFFNQILVQTANRKNIPTFVLLHGMPFDDIGTCPSYSRRILAWGESSASQLKEWGIPDGQIQCVGAPQYVNFQGMDIAKCRVEVFNDLSIVKDHSLVVYASQPFHTNRKADFLGNPMNAKTLTQMIRTLTELIQVTPKLTLIIKTHPREDKLWFTKKLLEASPGYDPKRILLVTDYDTNKLIAAGDVLITMGSTVFFEALLLKKAALFFDRAEKRYFPKMGSDFLDLDAPDQSILKIQNLLISSQRDLQIKLQEREVLRHFNERNNDPVNQALRAIHSSP